MRVSSKRDSTYRETAELGLTQHSHKQVAFVQKYEEDFSKGRCHRQEDRLTQSYKED